MLNKSILSRVFSLMRRLADPHSRCDVATLAKELGTSEKTIRRDLAELKTHGVVLLEDSGPHNLKTYSIDRSQLPAFRLTFDEALALYLGISSITAFAGSEIDEAARSALDKIRVSLGPNELSYVEKLRSRVYFTSHAVESNKREDIVDTLLIGIEDSKATFIEYHSASSTEPLTYDIYPYGLVEHRGSLYVVGHSCYHHEIRTWKVERILEAEVTLFPFQRPHDFQIEDYLRDAFAVVTGDQRHTVRIRFRSDAVRFVSEKKFHPSQAIETHPDSSATVTFELNSLLEVKSWVLSFGSKAEVLSPIALRSQVYAEIQLLNEQYSDPNKLIPLDSDLTSKKPPAVRSETNDSANVNQLHINPFLQD